MNFNIKCINLIYKNILNFLVFNQIKKHFLFTKGKHFLLSTTVSPPLLQLILLHQRISVLRGLQFLEGGLRYLRGHREIVVRRHHFRSVVVLPVQFPGIQVFYKLLEGVRVVELMGVVEEVHVSEAVDGNDGEIRRRLGQVRQRMCEQFSVGVQEAHTIYTTTV